MNRRCFTTACFFAASQVVRHGLAGAAEMPDDPPSTGRLNAVTPTLGGRQFWADELFFRDWHIQRNSFTGHYRLLDGSNLRHGWGTFAECQAKLEQIKQRRRLPPMRGPGVVVLHGLFRSGASMSNMARALRQQGGYSVFNVNYPTTRGTLTDHAGGLAKVMRSLEGIEPIHFVGHSLGNLVVRQYLADHTRPELGIRPDARIGRMVMLGPPNQGAQLAEVFAENRLFNFVAGASASQLAREWDSLAAQLATPAFPFGILAGGRGTSKGYNPFLREDNDMVVSVETTKLAGAADFAVLPVLHTLMMDDAKVQEYTLRFLERGYFVSDEQRHPLGSDSLARH
jgi:pimeloyl-ACP methyl ester carboxylesterase